MKTFLFRENILYDMVSIKSLTILIGKKILFPTDLFSDYFLLVMSNHFWSTSVGSFERGILSVDIVSYSDMYQFGIN